MAGLHDLLLASRNGEGCAVGDADDRGLPCHRALRPRADGLKVVLQEVLAGREHRSEQAALRRPPP